MQAFSTDVSVSKLHPLSFGNMEQQPSWEQLPSLAAHREAHREAHMEGHGHAVVNSTETGRTGCVWHAPHFSSTVACSSSRAQPDFDALNMEAAEAKRTCERRLEMSMMVDVMIEDSQYLDSLVKRVRGRAAEHQANKSRFEPVACTGGGLESTCDHVAAVQDDFDLLVFDEFVDEEGAGTATSSTFGLVVRSNMVEGHQRQYEKGLQHPGVDTRPLFFS
jgi:hypothetical protein